MKPLFLRFPDTDLASIAVFTRPMAFIGDLAVLLKLRWGIGLISAGFMILLAFSRLFTTFKPWDDEGYFLLAYRDFLSGGILYDQVFAPYGPFTFFTAGLLTGFDAANVTHDGFRWITLPVWIAIAGLLGGVVWRWTGRFGGSLAAFLLTGLYLQGLAAGVGHPQLWIILASAILLSLGCDWACHSGKEWRAVGTGVVSGAILLFKINLGIFAWVAIMLTLTLHLRVWYRPIVSGLLIVMAATFGVMIFFGTPSTFEKYFILAYLCSIGTIVLTAISQSPRRLVLPTCIIWFVVGFGACVCAGLGITLGLGTTPRSLAYNLIFAPFHLAKTYHYPFSIMELRTASSVMSLTTSLVGVAAAIVVFSWRRPILQSPLRLGLLKTAAGLALLLLFWLDNRAALPAALLFLWLLIVNVSPLTDQQYFNRLLLALLSALLTLQLYPMAGEQAKWAALLPITALAVMFGDGLNLLLRAGQLRGLPSLSGFAGRVGGITFASLLLISIELNAFWSFGQWKSEQSLNLPGALWLHLPNTVTNRLTAAVTAVAHNCRSLLTMPGLYSLSLWSGVQPFEAKRFNSGIFLWPEEVQQRELPNIRQDRHGCVLVSRSVYAFFRNFVIHGANDEVLTNVQQTMHPIASIQDISIYVAN